MFATVISEWRILRAPHMRWGKLKVHIHRPYLRLDTVGIYLKDRSGVPKSLREIGDAIDGECKRLRNAVFNGGAISGRFKENTF